MSGSPLMIHARLNIEPFCKTDPLMVLFCCMISVQLHSTHLALLDLVGFPLTHSVYLVVTVKLCETAGMLSSQCDTQIHAHASG